MTKYFLQSTTDGQAMVLFGHYYRDIKDYDNAIKYYSLAAELKYDVAAFHLACVYKKIGDIDNAIKHCQRNINNIYCLLELANYYRSIKDETNMIKYYQMGIDMKSGTAANNLGRYYYDNKNYQEAIKHFLMAFELQGNRITSNLSFCYGALGDYDNMKKICSISGQIWKF